jgi:hypothetical protein
MTLINFLHFQDTRAVLLILKQVDMAQNRHRYAQVCFVLCLISFNIYSVAGLSLTLD